MNRIYIVITALFGLAGPLLFGQSAATRAQFYGLPALQTPPPEVRPVQPFEPDFSAAVSLDSKYLREGWCQNSSPVAIGQFEISESGLYLGSKSVFNFSDRAGRGRHFQDVRYYMGCAVPFVNTGYMGPVTVDICWTYNTYPGDSRENSGEIALSFFLDEIWQKNRWALTGGLSFNHNYGKNETYAVADAAMHYLLVDNGDLQLENSLMLYWGDAGKLDRLTDGQCGGNAFYTFAWQCALSWNIDDKWSLTPYVEVDIHPDNRARRAAEAQEFNSAATLQAGLRLSCRF